MKDDRSKDVGGDEVEFDKSNNSINDVDTEEGALAQVHILKEKLAAAVAEKQEYLDGWQRMKADVVNIRRDESLRLARAVDSGKESVIENMLPVLDSFEMAQKSASWQTVDPSWRAGMERVFSQLEGALLQSGVKRIGKKGEQFDAHVHEPVAVVPATDDATDNTIVDVHQSGWQLQDKVIRPARVTVAHTE